MEKDGSSSLVCKTPDDQDLDMDLMKRRFATLILGGDLTGGVHGSHPTSEISNAIRNQCMLHHYSTYSASLISCYPPGTRSWNKELNFVLSPCDHIGTSDHLMLNEFVQRPDLRINLPKLRNLDAMLLEILDGFEETEFSYKNGWWKVAPGGLSERSRTQLLNSRACAMEISEAARSINYEAVDQMEVPQSYLASLPRSGKEAIGEEMYLYLAVDKDFSAHMILRCDLTWPQKKNGSRL